MITGASAGVGEACARRFAADGANLVLIARGEANLKRIGDELRAQCDVLTIPMDVARIQDCESVFQTVQQHFGGVDVLINNAGMHVRGNFKSIQASEIASMVDVNLKAPFVFSRTAIPLLSQSERGAIIMVGSLAGRAPLQGAATYSATKAALRAFTFALADELRCEQIKVAIVSPGPIDTGFIMSELDTVEDIVFSQPMSSAAQVAEAVFQLSSNKRTEMVMPRISGFLTTLGYLLPSLRTRLYPILAKKGRKMKRHYANRMQREDER